MKNKNWDIILAILWGLYLIINICLWATGETPGWIHVICADIIVICNYLERIISN